MPTDLQPAQPSDLRAALRDAAATPSRPADQQAIRQRAAIRRRRRTAVQSTVSALLLVALVGVTALLVRPDAGVVLDGAPTPSPTPAPAEPDSGPHEPLAVPPPDPRLVDVSGPRALRLHVLTPVVEYDEPFRLALINDGAEPLDAAHSWLLTAPDGQPSGGDTDHRPGTLHPGSTMLLDIHPPSPGAFDIAVSVAGLTVVGQAEQLPPDTLLVTAGPPPAESSTLQVRVVHPLGENPAHADAPPVEAVEHFVEGYRPPPPTCTLEGCDFALFPVGPHLLTIVTAQFGAHTVEVDVAPQSGTALVLYLGSNATGPVSGCLPVEASQRRTDPQVPTAIGIQRAIEAGLRDGHRLVSGLVQVVVDSPSATQGTWFTAAVVEDHNDAQGVAVWAAPDVDATIHPPTFRTDAVLADPAARPQWVYLYAANDVAERVAVWEPDDVGYGRPGLDLDVEEILADCLS